jgi:hypothetical protein
MTQYNYTQLGEDTFVQADGPLNPAKWTQISGDVAIATVSNLAQSPSTTEAAGALYTGIGPWPAAMWGSVQIVTDNVEVVTMYLRLSDDGTTGYEFDWSDNGDGTAEIDCAGFITEDNFFAVFDLTVPWNPGDIFKVATIGTTMMTLQNGVVVGSGTNNTVPIGTNLGLEISNTGDPTDVQLSNFLAGTLNVVTSGITLTFTTSERNSLQGTLSAKVQTLSPLNPFYASEFALALSIYQLLQVPGTIMVTNQELSYMLSLAVDQVQQLQYYNPFDKNAAILAKQVVAALTVY